MKAVSADQLRSGWDTRCIHQSSCNGTPVVISEYLGKGNYMSNTSSTRARKSLEAALGLIATYNFLLAQVCVARAVEAELKSDWARFRQIVARRREHLAAPRLGSWWPSSRSKTNKARRRKGGEA